MHREDQIRQTCHWERQGEEEDRRHDESQSIHWQIVVDAMGEKVDEKEDWPVGKEAVDVEQEPTKAILEQRPCDVASEKGGKSEYPCTGAHCIQVGYSRY